MTTVENPRNVGHMATRSSVGNNDPSVLDTVRPDDVEKVVMEDEIRIMEKIEDDEEIDSLEGEDDEDKLLQLALVNSVKEASSSGEIPMSLSVGVDESPERKLRYGLRKRQREGKYCPTTDVGTSDSTTASSSLGIQNPGQHDDLPDLPISPSLTGIYHFQHPASTSISKQPGIPKTPTGINGEHSHQGITRSASRGSSKPPPVINSPRYGGQSTVKTPPSASIARQSRRHSAEGKQRIATTPVAAKLPSKVPNPLLMSTPASQPSPRLIEGRSASVGSGILEPSLPCSLPVPCPLAPNNGNDQRIPTHAAYETVLLPEIAAISRLEVPLPAVVPSGRQVTLAEPLVQPESSHFERRQRIFSVDLDRKSLLCMFVDCNCCLLDASLTTVAGPLFPASFHVRLL
jgi:hypothetical protein